MFEGRDATTPTGGDLPPGMAGNVLRDGAASGPCCSEDDGYTTCVHARDLVRELVADERLRTGAQVRELGLDGLRELADFGDPWALDLLDEILVAAGLGAAGDERGGGQLPEDPLAGELAVRWGTTATAVDAESVRPAGAAGGPDTAGALASVPPGPELAALLAGIDLAETDAFSVVEVVAAYKRMEAWSAGRAALAAADLSVKIGPILTATGKVLDGSAEELAMRLAVTRQEAAKMVRVGRGLQGLFSETGAALVTGEIDYRRAAAIVTTLDGGSSAVAWVVEQEVLPGAGRRTPTTVERDLSEALIAVDPDEAQLRHTKARATRRVTHTQPLPDGMGRISAVLDAVDCVTIDLVLDSVAETAKANGDPRTMEQLRPDALMALVTGVLHTGWAGTPPGHTCSPGPGGASGFDAAVRSADQHPSRDSSAGGGQEPDSVRCASQGPGQTPTSAVSEPADLGSATPTPTPTPIATSSPTPSSMSTQPPTSAPGTAEGVGPERDETGSADEVKDPRPVSTGDASTPGGIAGDHVDQPTADSGVGAPKATAGGVRHGNGRAVPPDLGTAAPSAKDQERPPGDGRAVPLDVGTPSPGTTASPAAPGERATLPPDVGSGSSSGSASAATHAPGAEGVPSEVAAPGRRAAPFVTLPPLDLLITEREAMPLGVAPVQVRLTIPLSVAIPPNEGDGAIAGRTDGTELDIADALDRPSVEAAELAGYGPVTPDVARALAAGGTWRRVVTDPLSGAVLDLGRTRYRPPADLVEHVRQRDRTCVRPGCRTPAHRCQIDHTRAYSQGGTTSAGNSGPMCLRDHQLKTSGAFRVVQPSPGVFEWLTPTGHCYRREIDGTVTLLPSVPASLLDAIPF